MAIDKLIQTGFDYFVQFIDVRHLQLDNNTMCVDLFGNFIIKATAISYRQKRKEIMHATRFRYRRAHTQKYGKLISKQNILNLLMRVNNASQELILFYL